MAVREGAVFVILSQVFVVLTSEFYFRFFMIFLGVSHGHGAVALYGGD